MSVHFCSNYSITLMYKIVKKPTVYRKETVTKVYSYLRIGKVFYHDYKRGIYLISTSNCRVKYFYSKDSIPVCTTTSPGLDGYVVYINIDYNNESDCVLYVDKLSNFKDVGVVEDDLCTSTFPEKYIRRRPNVGNSSKIDYFLGYQKDYIFDGVKNHLISSPTLVDDDSRLLLQYFFSENNLEQPDSCDYQSCYHSLKAKISALDITAIFNSLKAELSIEDEIRGGRGSFNDEIIGSANISTGYIYYDSYLRSLLPTVCKCLYRWASPYMRPGVDGGCPPTSEMIEKWNIYVDEINQEFKDKIPQAIERYNQEEHISHLTRRELADKLAKYYDRKQEIERLKHSVDSVFSPRIFDILKKNLESDKLFDLIRKYNNLTSL